MFTLTVQTFSTETNLPTEKQFNSWIKAALSADQQQTKPPQIEVTLRLVDRAESAFLNTKFRRKHNATNVLSFPGPEPWQGVWYLGDLVLCAPLVFEEARQQQKQPISHWAHLVIHGTLHLLGYDHEHSHQAEIMESLETNVMATLGYGNPYRCD